MKDKRRQSIQSREVNSFTIKRKTPISHDQNLSFKFYSTTNSGFKGKGVNHQDSTFRSKSTNPATASPDNRVRSMMD